MSYIFFRGRWLEYLNSKRDPHCPPPPPFGSKRNINAPQESQILLKWESFLDESFQFMYMQSSWYSTTKYGLDSQDFHGANVDQAQLIRVGNLLFSITQCDFSAEIFFLIQGDKCKAGVGLFYCLSTLWSDGLINDTPTLSIIPEFPSTDKHREQDNDNLCNY